VWSITVSVRFHPKTLSEVASLAVAKGNESSQFGTNSAPSLGVHLSHCSGSSDSNPHRHRLMFSKRQ
jgi:hypothetical protein